MVTINDRELEEREKFLMEQLGNRGLSGDVRYQMDDKGISLEYYNKRFEPALYVILEGFEKKYNIKADMRYRSFSDIFWSSFWGGMGEMG